MIICGKPISAEQGVVRDEMLRYGKEGFNYSIMQQVDLAFRCVVSNKNPSKGYI